MALTRHEGANNFGGICQLRILKRSDFELHQVIYERYRGTGVAKISANDELFTVFPIAYHTPYLAFHEQPNERSKHSSLFAQKLKFSIPKDRPDMLAEFLQLQDEPIAVLFKNANGDWKVVGTEEDWAMLAVRQDTGATASDANKYQVEISCTSRYLAPFLEFEQRVEEPPPSEPCVAYQEGYSDYRPYPRELRFVQFNNTNLQAAGTYEVIWTLSANRLITVRSVESATVFDQRMVGAGQGSYQFTKPAERFIIIVEEGTSATFETILVKRICPS